MLFGSDNGRKYTVWNAVKRATKINKAITANSHHREEFTQELISHAIVTAGREI